MATKFTRDHHLLTRNLKLNGKYLSNDGGDYGIKMVDNSTITDNLTNTLVTIVDQIPGDGNTTDDHFLEAYNDVPQAMIVSDSSTINVGDMLLLFLSVNTSLHMDYRQWEVMFVVANDKGNNILSVHRNYTGTDNEQASDRLTHNIGNLIYKVDGLGKSITSINPGRIGIAFNKGTIFEGTPSAGNDEYLDAGSTFGEGIWDGTTSNFSFAAWVRGDFDYGQFYIDRRDADGNPDAFPRVSWGYDGSGNRSTLTLATTFNVAGCSYEDSTTVTVSDSGDIRAGQRVYWYAGSGGAADNFSNNGSDYAIVDSVTNSTTIILEEATSGGAKTSQTLNFRGLHNVNSTDVNPKDGNWHFCCVTIKRTIITGTITAVSRSGPTATYTTSTDPHGLSEGDRIEISGTTGFNTADLSNQDVQTTPDDTTFTMTLSAETATSQTGITATYSTVQTVKFFTDGVQEGTGQDVSQLTTTLYVADQKTHIGANSDENPGNFFEDEMMELGVWSTVLSPEAVKDIYNRGGSIDYRNANGGYSSDDVRNLKAYWKMDKGTGIKYVGDDSGNGNTLTSVNMDESNWVFTNPMPLLTVGGSIDVNSNISMRGSNISNSGKFDTGLSFDENDNILQHAPNFRFSTIGNTSDKLDIAVGASGATTLTTTDSTGATAHINLVPDGNVGIGVSDPDAHLEIFGITTQLKLSYDVDSYSTLECLSTNLTKLISLGDITLHSTANGATVTMGTGDAIALQFVGASNNWTIVNATSDADLIFSVNDGGVGTEVMRLNGDISSLDIASGKNINFGAAGQYIRGDGTDLVLSSGNDTTIATTRDLTLDVTRHLVFDVEGDIELNANGGDIILKDDTATFVPTAANHAVPLSHMPFVLYSQFQDDMGTSKHYLPLKGYFEQSTVGNEPAGMISPFNLRLQKAIMRCSQDISGGTWKLGMWAIASGANHAHHHTTGMNWITATGGVADTNATFDFTGTVGLASSSSGGSNTVTAGQWIDFVLVSDTDVTSSTAEFWLTFFFIADLSNTI